MSSISLKQFAKENNIQSKLEVEKVLVAKKCNVTLTNGLSFEYELGVHQHATLDFLAKRYFMLLIQIKQNYLASNWMLEICNIKNIIYLLVF